MSKLQFRVKYKFRLNDEIREGIETEASWFYLDQRGGFYSSSPMRPITPCEKDYDELIPLIKINDEYLTIEEISDRLLMFDKLIEEEDIDQIRQELLGN